jgi:hypothetical protein
MIEISRNGWGVFATLAILAIGGVALAAGIGLRWGWVELEFSDEAIRVTHGVARWPRRSDRISQPPPGIPMTAIVEIENKRGGPVYYLLVVDGVHSTPLEIGRQLHVDQERLRALAVDIELWASRGDAGRA